MKRVMLIVNPVAGKMRVKTNFFDIVSKLCAAGMAVEVHITRSRGDAIEIASTLKADRYDAVLCAGGDGTVNEVMCGIIRSGEDIPIGYIPCGSTNDFAQSMNININPISATEQIIEGTPKPIDVGLFDGTRNFSYIASFGAFTEASYSTPQQMKNAIGHFAYLLEGVKSLGNIKPFEMSVCADGKRYIGEYIFGAVANCTSIAGLLKLKRDNVDTNDGLFEVILAKNPQNAAELNDLLGAVLTANLQSPMLTFFKASKVDFSFADGMSWTLDGEEARSDKCVCVENLHARINLIR